LAELTLMEILLAIASFIESTAVLLNLTVCVHVSGISTLACVLPALSLLQYLELNTEMSNDDGIIHLSLTEGLAPSLSSRIGLLSRYMCKICCKALMLPSQSAGWTNIAAVLQHLRVKRHKLLAFGGGMHLRLGAASSMSSLRDTASAHNADEVLSGFSQLGRWQLNWLSR
jgi:hypothetical protein